MAVHSNMTDQSVPGLLAADGEEGDSSKQQLENENQVQMDLYDDLINDIIGVNNGLKPEMDNSERSSNTAIVPTTAVPNKADPSKYCVPDKTNTPIYKRKAMLIGNLTWWTTVDDLLAAIHSTGIYNVDEIKFYEVAKGGQSKGFVSVKLFSDCDVQRLFRTLPKKEVHGRTPDVRHFTAANYQYFETQFINAMEKSKLHSAKSDIFDPDVNCKQFAFDPLEEGYPASIPWQIQQKFSPHINLRSLTTDETIPPFPPFPQPPVRPLTSAVETKLQHGSAPFSPNLLLPYLTSLAAPPTNIPEPVLSVFPKFFFQYLTSLVVPPLNIPGPVLGAFPNFFLRSLTSLSVPPANIPASVLSGHGQSQTSQVTCVDPVTLITPSTSLSILDSNTTTPVYSTCYKDCGLPGSETDFQETPQSKKEPIKELDSKGAFSTNDQSKDDGSEDYGTLLRLVSFVKKSKAIAQDSFKDSNCSPNQSHGGESKRSGLREHEYPRHRENWRSKERSGSLRDRSRSPSSCDSHYQKKKMDYDQKRQQSHQRSHLENSSRIEHHSDRSRKRDNFDRERPCESKRYHSRNSDPWHIYSEKSGKGHNYSQEKYCRIKQKKDREYHF
ncbi:cleavage and polyadenylation specificity factor subunit 6-like [Carcharodon carcharias]|uniref:cleavage and polyadenylation specificity factor subunit 6-like n=1 Tax=Carcharodon carcharias TaxID=13397 RepID=UPI001B7E40ED|nr:cleavage and polyadenylation specificity factor subunit 6-like [Carcharodon carcharias]XP_041050819.1 cleavage and polyadenylation specificity factor subunit 6-like [Carcharodon carcharias]XP_041050820.1 cleavage and polyadenylation specificity factor subunit 6-like [Carcharodon carcharias]